MLSYLEALPQGGLGATVYKAVPMRVGEVDLLVQTVPVLGTESTSALTKAGGRDVFPGHTSRAILATIAPALGAVQPDEQNMKGTSARNHCHRARRLMQKPP
ncbi:MAG: hypothetical protein ACRDTG_10855 [Pseudonocardiaceae bacterium]